MKRTIVVAALLWLLSALSTSAHADDTTLIPTENSFEVGVTKKQPGAVGTHGGRPATQPVALPMCSSASLGTSCTPKSYCKPDPTSHLGGFIVRVSTDGERAYGPCRPAEPGEEAITGDLILSAFRRIPLPASRLVVQPPGGKTLVNLDTIFSTPSEPFERTVTLLGQPIRLKIWPSSFEWRHGDGTTQVTESGGIPYARHIPMDRYISHKYVDAGVTVRPSVNTSYSAEYSLDAGTTWVPVDGTVTITGDPASLQVVEARPVLTGNG